MKLRLALIALFIVAAAGCAKKEVKQDTPPDTGIQSSDTGTDNSVQNKDVNSDAQGSDSGKIDGLETVHFEYDKSAISAEGRGILQKDAQWIKAHSDSKVQIEGHCDRHGSVEYNLALGERRAKAVRAYLVNLGVSGKRLSTISYGKEKPLDTAETESADAQNRRANFVPSK